MALTVEHTFPFVGPSNVVTGLASAEAVDAVGEE